VSDLVALVAPVGLFFGRIANFVNGELWGRVTNVPWAMVFPRAPGGLPRHPSQLYEAATEGLLMFLIMQVCLMFKLHRRPGLLTAIFLVGYGTFRFISEFFREPDAPFLGPVSMGMALSIPIWLAAGALFALSRKKPA
jgi:phosphatidylglycerol:prolipoprotein diacylglycerol transferase